jgi:hypothetical protein
MPEGRDLRGFDALGKLRGKLSLGGGLWSEGVAGEMGVGAPGSGVGGVGTAGEETGDESSEAQGSNLKEVALGT